ncbi:MAG: hypothetical protein ABIJ56_20945 [Pseudomonadota bacterium]
MKKMIRIILWIAAAAMAVSCAGKEEVFDGYGDPARDEAEEAGDTAAGETDDPANEDDGAGDVPGEPEEPDGPQLCFPDDDGRIDRDELSFEIGNAATYVDIGPSATAEVNVEGDVDKARYTGTLRRRRPTTAGSSTSCSASTAAGSMSISPARAMPRPLTRKRESSRSTASPTRR